MCRISPGDSLSRNHRHRRTFLAADFRTSHAFDCKHFAAAERLTQRETAAALCKYCEALELPVERKGKVYFISAAHGGKTGGLPYNTPDDCASSRNAAGEAPEPGDRGNSRSRL